MSLDYSPIPDDQVPDIQSPAANVATSRPRTKRPKQIVTTSATMLAVMNNLPVDPVLGIPVHPDANAFPLMSPAEIQALADDIKKHGLKQPIIMCRGAIVDGRNRLAACRLAKVEPTFVIMDELTDHEILALVLSANIHRRHLERSQREVIAAKLVSMRPGYAGTKKSDDAAKCGNTRVEMAAEFGVPVSGLERARTLLKNAPDIAKQVEEGAVVDGRKLTTSGGLKLAKERVKKATPAELVEETALVTPATKPSQSDVMAMTEAVLNFKKAWLEINKYSQDFKSAELTDAITKMLKDTAKSGAMDYSDVIACLDKLQGYGCSSPPSTPIIPPSTTLPALVSVRIFDDDPKMRAQLQAMSLAEKLAKEKSSPTTVVPMLDI